MEKFNYQEKAQRLNELIYEIHNFNKDQLADLYEKITIRLWNEKINHRVGGFCYKTFMGVVHREGCTCKEVIISKYSPQPIPELHI